MYASSIHKLCGLFGVSWVILSHMVVISFGNVNLVQNYKPIQFLRYHHIIYTVQDLKRLPLLFFPAISAIGAESKLRYKHSGDLASVKSFVRMISTPALTLFSLGRRKMNAVCIPFRGFSCCRRQQEKRFDMVACESDS